MTVNDPASIDAAAAVLPAADHAAMSSAVSSAVVRARGLCRSYRRQIAIDSIDLTIRQGTITGLLGRNGAGKSTLLRMLAGQERPDHGDLAVFGGVPFENPAVQHRMMLMREDQGYPDFKARHALAIAAGRFPQWHRDLADELVQAFGIPVGRSIKKLSRGMRSGLGIVIALASRAELTLLDEPYAGLDPVARQLFYDHLLADYTEHPRTIVLSTHLVDEIAGLLEHVVVLDRARVTIDAPADEVRGSLVQVSGPSAALAEFTDTRTVVRAGGMGAYGHATVAGGVTDAERAAAQAAGLRFEPVTLQQLVVNQAGRETVTAPVARGARR